MRHDVGGQGENWRRRPDPLNLIMANEPRGRDPIHDWHLHIHEDQIPRPGPPGLRRFLAVVDHDGGNARLFQDRPDDNPVHWVVFCDQNAKVIGRREFDLVGARARKRRRRLTFQTGQGQQAVNVEPTRRRRP